MTAPPPSPLPGRLAALFLVLQFVLMWTAFFVLSSAIGWPASLDDPASIALPRVLAEGSSMMLGYGSYLMVGLLLVPATAALNARMGLTGAMAGATLSLAVLAAMAKSIGITRWLFAMPAMAEAYVAPGADQAAIAVQFDVLNAWAGGIGEILGVGLLSGAWTVLVAVALFSAPGRAAKVLAAFTLATGLLLFAAIPAGLGVDLGPVLTLSGILWQFALFGIAGWALTARRA